MNKRKLDYAQLNEEFLQILRPQTHGNFSQALIDELAPLGFPVQIKAGQCVLKTGQANDSLYILLEGSLEIRVEGELVAELKRKGDLVGELSIISEDLCSADVIATTDSNMLKVSVKELKARSSEHEVLLYKILCLTLTEKLENTNIKAKNFETLSRTLEEEVLRRTSDLRAKNSELTLGYKKLEAMHAENMHIMDRLAQIDEDYVKSSLKLLEKEKNIETVKANLQLIHRILSPIKDLKSEHEHLEGQQVLLVESNTKQRNMIKMALGGTGVKVEMAKTADEAKEILLRQNFNILFLSAEMLEIADFVRDNKMKTKIVLLTEEESKDYLSKIKNYGFLSNIIATKEDDRAFNIKSISTTVSKMTGGDIFGLEKYLNWGVEVKEFEIADSKDRQALNDKVIEHLTELGVRNTLRTRCQIVIEELLMNAIYDAPVDEKGTPLHNHKSRTEAITLAPHQKAKLRFATDGLFLAISVEDPFGVFKKETIFKYLENNYYNPEIDENSKEGKGGAGKGIYMITESSDLVIYNVAPGTKTEVIAMFDLDVSKDKKATSLHYFEL